MVYRLAPTCIHDALAEPTETSMTHTKYFSDPSIQLSRDTKKKIACLRDQFKALT